MADYQLSYDFQDKIRDLQPAFETLIKSRSSVLKMFKTGAKATQTKVEWMEMAVSEFSTAITGFVTDGDGVGFDVGTTAGLRAGMIIGFEKATGVSVSEVAKISVVDSPTRITIVRDYGGSTGVTLVATDKIFIISEPRGESSSPVTSGNYAPGTNFNYTEIFDMTATVSRTAQQSNMYGISDLMSFEVATKMENELMRKLQRAVLFGLPVERTNSEAGTMGGIFHFLKSGNVKAVNGALTVEAINDVMEMISTYGAATGNYSLLIHPMQARNLAALNKAPNNPYVTVLPTSQTISSGAVSTFISDLPGMNGFTANIVLDNLMPKDKMLIIDTNLVEFAPLQPLIDKDVSGVIDGYARRLLTETTIRVRNGKELHGMLTGLNI